MLLAKKPFALVVLKVDDYIPFILVVIPIPPATRCCMRTAVVTSIYHVY